MSAHGYILKGNSRTAPTSYTPSLIGVLAEQVKGAAGDPYFERIEIADRAVTSLAFSRWVNFDNLPDDTRDPILEVRGRGASYYIPMTELHQIAAENHDDDTIELLDALKATRR